MRTVLTAVLFFQLIYPCVSAVFAADEENCVLCHKYPGLGRIDDSGKKHLYYVNGKDYTRSVHGRIRCKECHVDVDKFPHVDLQPVNCSNECHVVEPSVERKFSHSKMISNFQKSVHGKGSEENPGKHPEDLPSCVYCHQNRILTPAFAVQGTMDGVAQEILDRCLGCHEDEKWTSRYYLHLTHRLKQRRSSKKMVELCASCHEDTEKMARHGLEATGTYRDTFHWQSIKYNNENAPTCIDCHAPVGYFAHEIMPKTDPRSSVHKDNLVQTCSNSYGMQDCHPDSTPAFAQGKIHPTGEKASLFDLQVAMFERKENIKKGLSKPVQAALSREDLGGLTTIEYYQAIVLQLIKYFYKILIAGLISFMIFHQVLDFFATRREMKKGGHK